MSDHATKSLQGLSYRNMSTSAPSRGTPSFGKRSSENAATGLSNGINWSVTPM